MTYRPGEQRLKSALAKLLRGRPRRPPISLLPESPFEAILLERLNQLQRDVEAIQDQQSWIIRLVAGIIIAAILNYLIK